MNYKIYELVRPEVLKRIETEGYDRITTELISLKEMNYYTGIDYEYQSEGEAMDAILTNKDKLKHKELIVVPVIRVGWDGKVS